MTAPASREYRALVATGRHALTRMMVRGEAPDGAALLGWEYRGTNMPAASAALGMRRFIKGFTADANGGVVGYNKQVGGADLGTPWTPRPQRDGRIAFAPFRVTGVDPEAVDNRYLHALLFDYSAVPNSEAGVAGRLRDYVVRVNADSEDLLLGRAFLAFGTRRFAVGWFALERLQPVDSAPAD